MAVPSLRTRFTLQIKPLTPTSVVVSPAKTAIFVGVSVSLAAIVAPEKAVDKTVVWSTSNPSIATVKNGIVTAHKTGNVTISATTSNGKTAQCAVRVEPKTSIRILKTSISTNYVDGVDPNIYWRNDSGKTIKYITFVATAYNAVGDVARCEIRRQTTMRLQITGPIQSFSNIDDIQGGWFKYKDQISEVSYAYDKERGLLKDQYEVDAPYPFENYRLKPADYFNVYNQTHHWNAVWYNGDISYFSIARVEIICMDGTTETIISPIIWQYML